MNLSRFHAWRGPWRDEMEREAGPKRSERDKKSVSRPKERRRGKLVEEWLRRA